ncbi:MAG: hypothetical protein HYW23_00475 [Candidatus Aenigmarchaeota archaeon]|nr:hypothetical protein [Candidatus Aenigmarchaeota archaeon]
MKSKPKSILKWFGIIVGIFFLAMIIWGILGYLSYSYILTNSTTSASPDVQKFNELSSRSRKEVNQFSNEIKDYSVSLKAGDTIASRSKVTNARNILIDLKNDYQFVCDFQESNKQLFSSDIEILIQKCKGFLDVFNLCYPKYLDSLYSLTYLVEQGNQAKTQQGTQNYQTSCASWLNDWNIVRGSCSTLSEKYYLGLEFADLSEMCKLN